MVSFGGVAGDRGTVDEGVLVGVFDGPGADGAADGGPAGEVVVRGGDGAGVGEGLLGGGTDRVVGVDDEGGEKVVTAGK